MPKKSRVTTFMDSQHVKESERLLKSAQNIFIIFFDNSELKSAPTTLF